MAQWNLFRDRSGPAVNRMLSAFVTGMLALLMAQGPLAQDEPGVAPRVVTQVPLQMRGSRLTLDVRVNGQGPFAFGLDTGASGTAWVTRALVERLNLPLVDGFVISDDSGVKGRSADGVRIDAITLGTVSFSRLTAPVLGSGPRQDGDAELWGTLGFELFRDYVVTFDYPAQQLRVATGQLGVPDGKRVLSYRLDHGSPQILIDIGGLGLDASIDTGNIGGILLPLSLADKVPIRVPLQRAGTVASAFNEFDLFRSELDGNVQIGEATIVTPTLFFSDLVQGPNLGRDVVRSFAVTFDQANMRVQFQPSTHQQ